jgi:hypothetical protein
MRPGPAEATPEASVKAKGTTDVQDAEQTATAREISAATDNPADRFEDFRRRVVHYVRRNGKGPELRDGDDFLGLSYNDVRHVRTQGELPATTVERLWQSYNGGKLTAAAMRTLHQRLPDPPPSDQAPKKTWPCPNCGSAVPYGIRFCTEMTDQVNAVNPDAKRHDDLTGTQMDILHGAVTCEAFDRSHAVALPEILKKGGIKASPESRNIRDAVSDLKERAFLKASRGTNGGYWITPEGRAAVGG